MLKLIKILNYNKSLRLISALNCFKYFQIGIIYNKIETFWPKDIRNIQDISRENYSKFSCILFSGISCFKYFQIYILGQMSQKYQTSNKIELCQNVSIYTKFFELYKVSK